MKTEEFVALVRRTDAIYVADDSGGIHVLKRGSEDVSYALRRGDKLDQYPKGSGTYEDPFSFTVAAVYSPFYVVLLLWSNYRPRIEADHRFIQINGVYLIRLTPDGIVSTAGQRSQFV